MISSHVVCKLPAVLHGYVAGKMGKIGEKQCQKYHTYV
jgi:hypothetical protein